MGISSLFFSLCGILRKQNGAVKFGMLLMVFAVVTLLSAMLVNVIDVRYSALLGSIFMFIVSSFVISYILYDDIKVPLPVRRCALPLLVISVFMVLPMQPVISLFNEIIMMLPLGDDFAEMMRASAVEDEADVVRLVSMYFDGSVWSMILLYITAAVVPAVGEEFFCRGVLYRILGDSFKNPHLAIWTSALIFALMHLRMSQFIGITLWGAFFGYLRFWSGSLLPSMTAHLVNNVLVLSLLAFENESGCNIESMIGDMPEFLMLVLTAFGLICLYVFLRIFKSKCNSERENNGVS